jgi:hypothetical protein
MDQLDKEIGQILIEFYDTMKQLENDFARHGKQATKLIMTINDLKELIEKTNSHESKINL